MNADPFGNPTPCLRRKAIPAFPGIQVFWTRVGARSLPAFVLMQLGEEAGEEVALQPSPSSKAPFSISKLLLVQGGREEDLQPLKHEVNVSLRVDLQNTC